MKTAYENYNKWLLSPAVSDEMKKELESVRNNEEEIRLRFSSSLSFGTAGLRGVMAAGTNNMNVHTVAQATQGLADYIKSLGRDGVAIACDTRNNSELFSRVSAEVLAGNGIRSYIFDGPRPTPELSFALRYLHCVAGINITASHNPKEYNGYKAYWEDGAQLGPEQADAVSECISGCDIFEGIVKIPFEEGISKGLITVIGSEVDEVYLNCVLGERVNSDAIPSQPDMKVVYTPLHGAGRIMVPEALKRAGVKNLITVEEQMIPDGNFPTVRLPNPEFPEAFELGKKLAEENGCDFIVATDPDSDRMGIMVRSGDSFVTLTGNQIGCLLLDYIITAYREKGLLTEDAYAVKSIVSTELATDICRKNGVRMYDVLTGFKYIGEVIKKHESAGYGRFLLGFEESYGFLKGTYARDKDAVVASLLAVEMAAYYRSNGLTLKNALDSLYEKYGYYIEKVESISFPGSDGQKKMKKLMKSLRDNLPAEVGSERLTSVRDYLSGEITDLTIGNREPTGMPYSDVLYCKTESSVLVIRPSGTEPKVKIYYMVNAETREKALTKLEKCRISAEKILKNS